MPVRILFLADSHLGFDLPVNPRVQRRRRGHDFLANYRRALAPALAGEADLVVHGGDVFHHPRVHPTLVAQAFEPLQRLAEGGTPVFVVPGNHEGCRIPHARFSLHPGIHVFDRPRTFRIQVREHRLALLGFPYQRRGVRQGFAELLRETGWRGGEEDVALLCVHHCFEGARVGPGDFTFRHAPDVIRGRDLPAGLAAVLTGHVHRHQVLTRDLEDRPLAAPVLYPGSVERTAFAEMGEPKGYLALEVDGGASPMEGPGGKRGGAGGHLRRWEFHHLPTRPMVSTDLPAHGLSASELASRVEAILAGLPEDAVLRLKICGPIPDQARAELSAPRLRTLAPEGMNMEVIWEAEARRRHRDPRPRRRGGREPVRISLPAQPGLFPP